MPDARSLDPHIGGKRSIRRDGRELDAAIARLAEQQHGVVARQQLHRLGVGRHAIDHRLAAGRLHPLYRGVYSVGHRILMRRGRWMAAALAAGPGAVLSHRSAASLWGLIRSVPAVADVTTRGRHRSRVGISLHRARLPPDEVTTADGIPATTPHRTLFDLAVVVDRLALERAIEQADARSLTDALSLGALLERHPRRPGAATLRAILDGALATSAPTRSELEDRFLALLAAHGLPRPRVNLGVEARGRWFECDLVWRSQRLIVELDGRATHRTAAAFERDRARDRALQATGWRVVRITWRQLHDEDARVAADLRALLTIPP
jgi:predicted transcriptional regulator of viral defense system